MCSVKIILFFNVVLKFVEFLIFIIKPIRKGDLMKLDVSGTTKYIIYAKIEVDGVVEKPDVIGAIFGQTEGLLGDDLDFRELQKSGRLGRIEVELKVKGGKTEGLIIVPSSLDRVETAIIAAALETVDRVGPCEAKVQVEKIEDIRENKRKKIINRAIEILKTMIEENIPDSLEIVENVKERLRTEELIEYGPEKLPAGPDIKKSDTIILVEGRADVINLLRCGIRNVIAVEGTSIPKTIVELSKKKTTIAFVDGDRGGELILRELLQVADIDYVARAPEGKEVENLTKKEILKALKNKVPIKEYMSSLEFKKESLKTSNILKKYISEIINTLESYILDKNLNIIEKIPVANLAEYLRNTNKEIYGIIMDGIITQRIVDIASEKKISFIVGNQINIVRKPLNIVLLTMKDVS